MAKYQKENVILQASGDFAKELELQGYQKMEKKEKPKKKGDQ